MIYLHLFRFRYTYKAYSLFSPFSYVISLCKLLFQLFAVAMDDVHEWILHSIFNFFCWIRFQSVFLSSSDLMRLNTTESCCSTSHKPTLVRSWQMWKHEFLCIIPFFFLDHNHKRMLWIFVMSFEWPRMMVIKCYVLCICRELDICSWNQFPKRPWPSTGTGEKISYVAITTHLGVNASVADKSTMSLSSTLSSPH